MNNLLLLPKLNSNINYKGLSKTFLKTLFRDTKQVCEHTRDDSQCIINGTSKICILFKNNRALKVLKNES